jgi:hypothetical protein
MPKWYGLQGLIIIIRFLPATATASSRRNNSARAGWSRQQRSIPHIQWSGHLYDEDAAGDIWQSWNMAVNEHDNAWEYLWK